MNPHNMEEFYQSQEALILRRAKDRNVDIRQLQQFFKGKIKEISANYPNPAYSYLWRLSKIEYLVWERFFPTDPFPGVLEYIPARSTPTLPTKLQAAINMAWAHDRYNPNAQPPSMRATDHRDRRGSESRPRDDFPKMNRQRGDHYSPPPLQPTESASSLNAVLKDVDRTSRGPILIAPQGPNAHQRLTQTEIAARDSQYPRPLTYKEQLHNAGEAIGNWVPPKADQELTQSGNTSRETLAGSANNHPDGFASPALRLDPKLNPNQSVGQSRQLDPNQMANYSGRGLRKDLVHIRQEHNKTGEAYMNHENVMERRAMEGNFRSKMFCYLQKARDDARAKHPHCTRYVRGYLSEKQTWQHFWPNDKFPGIEPRTGHSERCLARSGKYHPNAATLNAHSNKRPLSADTGSVCSAPALNGMLSTTPFAISSPISILNDHQEPTTRSLKLQATNRAPELVTLTSLVTSEPLDRSIELSSTSLVPYEPGVVDVGRSGQFASRTNALMTTAPASLTPVFSDPEKMWNQFKRAFRVSDSDRAMLENDVKIQGQLRLVLDDINGQVITVEELVKRIQYRYALKCKLKRKAEEDDIEKDRVHKRATNFLDNLAREIE